MTSKPKHMPKALAALAAGAAILSVAPAAAKAEPSRASAYLFSLATPQESYKEVFVSVLPQNRDEVSRSIGVRYEAGGFVITDSAGVVAAPNPSVSSVGDLCVQINPNEVRCPIDLTDPAILLTDFIVATGDGDDRIDLRRLPDLPGLTPTQSTEGSTDGDARPYFATNDGDDVVLTGAFDSGGGLGDGADRFRGGPGRDGAIYPQATSLGGSPVMGGAGPDRLVGGPGDDWLLGGSGGDFLKGDAGMDILIGGYGNDRIFSRDGEVDRFSCGAGNKRRQPIRRDRFDTSIPSKKASFRGRCRAAN